ncbi:MAG: hypothetical protein ACKPKP_03165 [Dolichospermum sp.]
MSLENKDIGELFKLADKIGKKRYDRLTEQDFDNYRKFDHILGYHWSFKIYGSFVEIVIWKREKCTGMNMNFIFLKNIQKFILL